MHKEGGELSLVARITQFVWVCGCKLYAGHSELNLNYSASMLISVLTLIEMKLLVASDAWFIFLEFKMGTSNYGAHKYLCHNEGYDS